jgi:mannose-6-phosphate isomerase
MSFMFNPFPYDDYSAINRVPLSKETVSSCVSSVKSCGSVLAGRMAQLVREKGRPIVVGFDGFPSAEFLPFIETASQVLSSKEISVKTLRVDDAYKSSEEIEDLLSPCLPEDKEKDPVLLYGKLFKGTIEDIFDPKKLIDLKAALGAEDSSPSVTVLYGCGAGIQELRGYYDLFVYVDVIPKDVVLRFRNGRARNLGDGASRTYRERMRRYYYFDCEVCSSLRAEIVNGGFYDFYIASSDPSNPNMLPRAAFEEVCAELVKQPFRCKPVYNEGVWGGYLTMKERKLPSSMKNCAWVFDLIPLEVSLLVEVGTRLLDIPYALFVRKEGVRLMGRECVDLFGGYFPVRFNYDDTFHSNGNMSIQVHPGERHIKENFNEHGRQDESYYIVATGHGAKTYCGLKEGVKADEFWKAIDRTERDHVPMNYEEYVNSVRSVPGTQFLLPAGTIHASGRNQLILEIGSLTIGSYTFKLYDYLRKDLDGQPRPIHSYYGKQVLETSRDEAWVRENLVREPSVVAEGENWRELVVGEHELLYFSLRRLEFEDTIAQDTQGSFHVLVFVDGERAVVESLGDPSKCYTMNYLDMVVVPASVGAYRIRNLGDQPICVHKTQLKRPMSRRLP